MNRLFFIVTLFFSQYAFCQDYLPFLKGSKTWEAAEISTTHFGAPSGASFYYRIGGDSVLSGTTYQIVERAKTAHYKNGFFYPLDEGQELEFYVHLLLREDTVEKKVFGWVPLDQRDSILKYPINNEYNDGPLNTPFAFEKEYLFLDFNISYDSIGNWVTVNDFNRYYLDSISEKDFGDGILRRQWHFQDIAYLSWTELEDVCTLVEGIGPLENIIRTYGGSHPDPDGTVGSYHYYVSCYGEYGQSLYPEFDSESICAPGENLWYIPDGVSENYGSKQLMVFPNPIINNTLNFDSKKSGKLEILDINGKLICFKILKDEDVVSFENTLSEGSYFLRITDYFGGIYTKRITVR